MSAPNSSRSARTAASTAPGARFTTRMPCEIAVEGPARGLESDARPHFFGGVATVVAKLFIACAPDIAVFGEKGLMWVEVEATGAPAHGAHVHKGTNAIDRLRTALDYLKQLEDLPFQSPPIVTSAIGKDGKSMTLQPKRALVPGTYTVKWSAAGADTHRMGSEFSFTVK